MSSQELPFLKEAKRSFESIRELKIGDAADFSKFDQSLADNISKVQDEIFKNIQYSILAGEYLFNESIELLDSLGIDKLIEDYQSDIEEAPLDLHGITLYQGSLEKNIKNEFSPFIKGIRSLYKDFILKTKRLINNRYHKVVFYKESEELLSFRNEKVQSSLIRKQLYTTSLNLRIALLDHTLSSSDEFWQRALELREQLSQIKESSGEEQYFTFLKEKIGALLKKLAIRAEKEESEQNPKYIVDSLSSEHELKKSIFEFDSYKKFILKSVEHYLFEKIYSEKQKLIARAKPVEKEKNTRTLTFEEFHTLTKYYKDVTGSYTDLCDLFSFFKEKEFTTEFDNNAKKTAHLYIVNNLFSLAIEKKETHDDILKEIENFQEVNSINNYFPYLKLFKKSVDLLDPLKCSNFKDFEAQLHLSQNYYQKLQKSFDWAKENSLLIYQLPFEECLTDEFPIMINGSKTSIRLFLASSFVVPIDYDTEKRRIKELQNKQYSTMLSYSVKITDSEITAARTEIKEQMNREISGNQIKSIETIGLFAAVISLLIGGVKIFKFVKNINQGLLAFMTFGAVIALFMLLLHLVIKHKEKNTYPHIIVAFIILCMLMVAFVSQST